MHHKLLLFVFSIFLKHFVVSNFNIFADASEEIPHYVIAEATYWRQKLPCSDQPVCAAWKTFSSTTQAFFRRCRRAARARPLTCSDAPAYTKETVIAPRDTTTDSRMEKQWCCMACLEINSGKCCAKCCCCSRWRREADGQREERA